MEEAIDPAIGKKVFRVGGTTSATNYLALPKASVPGGLGLKSPYLYLQLCLLPGQNFTVHLDVVTDRKFGVRISLSSRYSVIKRVGTVVQLPCPQLLRQTVGKWAVLALDLPDLVGALPVHCARRSRASRPAQFSLRAFVTEQVYTPATLPRLCAAARRRQVV